MKKFILSVAAAAVLAAGAFAEQPHTISFDNEVSSDTLLLKIEDGNASVAGFKMYEVAAAEFESDRLDAAIQVGFDWSFPVEKYAQFDWTSDALDYYIEFRPINWLTVVFHDEIFTRGSRLLATGAATASGNIGSDFGLVFRPIGGLRLAAGADFLSGIGHDHSRPIINFGADYAYGSLFQAGVTVRNPFSFANKIAVGAFFSYYGLEALTLNAGYTFRGGEFSAGDGGNDGLTASSPVTVPSVGADLFGHAEVLGTHLIQLSAAYAKDGISCALDFAVAPSAASGHDLFAALDAGYDFSESVSADVLATVAADFDGTEVVVIGVYPKASFQFAKNHTVSAGVKVQFEGSDIYLAIPVSYTFRYKI